jgi:Putative porin
MAVAATLAILAPAGAAFGQSSDPLLNTLIKKGILTEDEARSIKSEADASQSNSLPAPESKWKISNPIKNVELFGDLRFRYEYRSAQAPTDDRVALDRYRYAFRLGLRGELVDQFYYGFRLETAANPRSPWVTFGSSTSGTPYQGPFGKSTAGINLGQIYLGWRPADWVDITVGKMANPLYTTPMTWDTDLNPEGLAERFKYPVGEADFFANFGQFIYQDTNPNQTSGNFFPSLPVGQNASQPFLLASQIGLVFHFDKDVSAKMAPVLYYYTGVGVDSSTFLNGGNGGSPGFADAFVGEGANYPANAIQAGSYNGYSGYPGGQFDGFASDQTGINNLLILDIPAEFNFKIKSLSARVFGDFAENLDGAARAAAAANAITSFNNNGVIGLQFVNPIPVEANQNKAYQAGFAIGSEDSLGLVYGTTSRKNAWEFRTYWQHVEQYALDPNLLDSDFFEGRGNLQGLYAAFAWGLTDNIIATVRGGYASRIDDKLGTGGSNQDIPQVNPINRYQILQFDLTCRF